MEQETHKTTENMKKFFEKLADLKAFVKEKSDETKNEVITEIYNKLDQIIKFEGK